MGGDDLLILAVDAGRARVRGRMKDPADTERTTIVLPVEEGSPWSVCLSSETEDGTRAPRLRYSVHLMGKPVDGTRDLSLSLLDPEWRLRLKEAFDICLSCLRDRQAPVPDRFCFELEQALVDARRASILLVVRGQAASLIRHVSAEEACRVWMEAEAFHVLES